MWVSSDTTPEFEVENCRVCINVKDWAERVRRATATKKAAMAAITLGPQVMDGVSADSNEELRCPPDSTVLGRATWTFLHTMSVYYPNSPTPSQQSDMHGFLSAFSRFYPCAHCAAHMRTLMEEDPPQVSSRSSLAAWLCRLHNEVNVRLGKPIFDCSRVFERWRDGPTNGSCDEADIHIR